MDSSTSDNLSCKAILYLPKLSSLNSFNFKVCSLFAFL